VQATSERKRSELNGTRLAGVAKPLNGAGDAEAGNLVNWRRESLSGTGHFSEGSTSIFNKKKWLPLCRDTQFRISHMCCSVMKKGPMSIYQRNEKRYPYIGTLTEESKLREQAWIRHGCNSFEGTHKTSQPMSFWTEQDVLHYIWEEGLEIASVYGNIVAVDGTGFEYEPSIMCCDKFKCTGCQRTGCVFCGFGVHLEKGETRFQRLAKTHPRQYEYCIGGGQWVDNPDYDPAAPKMDGDWENWNPKKIWVPSKKGLGMKKIFDDCNRIYGKDFIRYD
jgi:3'-phosphoadenosine 5'-phosphosulfate sulfotransferase (PAPS reductase)/FAD synthetase